jgi:hypothetical protein
VTVFTAIWIALGVVGGVTELVALLNRRDKDTLSEQFWRVTQPAAHVTVRVWLLRAIVITVMLWLAGHFGLGWWTLSHPGPWLW